MAKKIGWTSELRRYATSTQREALIKAGVPEEQIYDAAAGHTMADMLNDATKNAVLCVHRLAALGRDRARWRLFVDTLAGRSLKVIEVSTGHRFDMPADLAEAIADLTNDWAGNKITAAQARNAGRNGAKKRWGNIDRTPIRIAAPVWKDWVNFPRPQDALAHPDMAGWTESAAKKKIGKRGSPRGPIAARDVN